MPQCGHSDCPHCGSSTAWKRRSRPSPAAHERATRKTRDRLVKAFTALGVAVTFGPSPFGNLWETITLNGIAGTVKMCDGAVLFRRGMRLTHLPLRKRSMLSGADDLQRCVTHSVKAPGSLPEADLALLAEWARLGKAPETRRAFDSLRSHLAEMGRVEAGVDGDRISYLRFGIAMSIEHAAKLIECATSLGILPLKAKAS